MRYYAENLKKDSAMIYPEIGDTLEISDAYIQFHAGKSRIRVLYNKGPEVGETTRRTPIALALEIDEKRVFDFKMEKTVRYTPEMPCFNETMGEVTSFIEGPWVTDVAELLQRIKAHEKNVRDKRQAPRLQQKLREDMKRFGL